MIPGRASLLVLHGLDVVTAAPGAPGAVAFESTIGAGKMPVRPPQSLRHTFDKLATGEPIKLTDHERQQVEDVGVKLADVTALVRERDMRAALAKGAAADVINSMPPTDQHFKAMQPVVVTKSFIPAQKTY